MNKYQDKIDKINEQLDIVNKYNMRYGWAFFEDENCFQWAKEQNEKDVINIEEQFKKDGWETQIERWPGKDHNGWMLRVYKR